MAEAPNNPEKQKQQPKPAPVDETTRTVLGKFDEKEEENLKKVEEMFEGKLSTSKIGEIGIVEVRKMKEDQKKAVRDTFDRFKKEFQDKSQENKSERDTLAAQLLEQAQSEAEFRILNLQVIFAKLVKGDYMTEDEAAAIKRVIVGVEKISTKDIETQQILLKLKGDQELNGQDYNFIVDKVANVNPAALTSKDAKPQERFEVTTAGILIGFMSPRQRYKMIEVMMDSPKRNQTAEVIDGFLRTGILTVAQGEELFKEAVQKKVMTQEDFDTIYKKNFDKGFYVDEVKKVRDAINAEANRMRGMYSENLMNRVVGSPMIGAGMLLHSFFWILTNVLASGGDFKSLFRNPYIWAALGEGALALEVTSGSMKKGVGEFGIGAGWVSRAVEKFTEKEGPKTSVEKNALAVMGDMYLNYLDFGKYLENGGAMTILKIRKAKAAQGLNGKELAITFDELMKSETDKTRQGLLADAQKKFPQKTAAQINGIAEIMIILKMESQEDFNSKLGFVKDSQGLTSGPAAVPARPLPQPGVVTNLSS